MGTIFSETLSKLRKEAGFKTAYRFFHDNGGKEILKVSYRMYLLMEQGKLMPPFKNLGIYVYSLRLTPHSYSAAELTTAWLKTTLGESEFLYLLSPFLKMPGKQSITSPLHRAIKRELTQRTFHINLTQLRVILKSGDTYLCWSALSNDTGAWTPETLASQLKIPLATARNSLRELAAARLLKVKKGIYTCPMAAAVVEGPHAMPPDVMNKMIERDKEFISSGKPVFARRGIIRASAAEFWNYFPMINLNVATAATYGVTEKQKDSALFAIEATVVKLRDF